MQKGSGSKTKWVEGRCRQRSLRQPPMARLAAGTAQSSASCLMFSMETGSSAPRALSGVAASTCSSFMRTAMTEGGGGGVWGREREKERLSM